MDIEDRKKYLEIIRKTMVQRMQAQQVLNESLREFSERLFAAIEKVLAEMQANGIPGVGKTRRLVHPAGGGREGLQIFIEDWSIIFVPLLGFARPSPADEAHIPTAQFKEWCGRIGVFLNDDPQGRAFYDFIIFQDKSWFAWGYGWPKQQAHIDNTNFEALALELIESFINDIFITWYPRAETTLATSMDPKKRAYVFGLPGEELQGG